MLKIIFLLAFIYSSSLAEAQYSKIIIDSTFKDTFTFHKNWDYPEGVFKDEETGLFENIYGGKIKKQDTAHLHYTARCTTDVQGGYEINYCYGKYDKDSFLITIHDGLPAYASNFHLVIKKGSFYLSPELIFPMHLIGEKITYNIVKQKLVCKALPKKGKWFTAVLDMEFNATSSAPNRTTETRSYFLKGEIRLKLL